MVNEDNWRLRGQERYLTGQKFSLRQYKKYRNNWEHDHCEFCFAKFTEDDLDNQNKGYVTENHYYWVCQDCFQDFKEKFKWIVVK